MKAPTEAHEENSAETRRRASARKEEAAIKHRDTRSPSGTDNTADNRRGTVEPLRGKKRQPWCKKKVIQSHRDIEYSKESTKHCRVSARQTETAWSRRKRHPGPMKTFTDAHEENSAETRRRASARKKEAAIKHRDTRSPSGTDNTADNRRGTVEPLRGKTRQPRRKKKNHRTSMVQKKTASGANETPIEALWRNSAEDQRRKLSGLREERKGGGDRQRYHAAQAVYRRGSTKPSSLREKEETGRKESAGAG
ncbi:hypothetical protein C8R46DRAFT_1024895 [Mycena filopes]|nr:hypothetical protein C8R46DRAFT_1024895 [Mycena filopes]